MRALDSEDILFLESAEYVLMDERPFSGLEAEVSNIQPSAIAINLPDTSNSLYYLIDFVNKIQN